MSYQQQTFLSTIPELQSDSTDFQLLHIPKKNIEKKLFLSTFIYGNYYVYILLTTLNWSLEDFLSLTIFN